MSESIIEVLRALRVRHRLWERVDQSGSCWLWTGPVGPTGYGQVTFREAGRGRTVYVHRAIYTLAIGPIPPGLQIDHLCRVRHCVNPDHLEAVTPRENVRRSLPFREQTHCKRGHPFDEANTVIFPDGGRRCRTCQNAGRRRSRLAKKQRA